MTELQGLVVDVEARITKLERGLAKANQTQRKAAAQMQRTAEDNARRIERAYDGIGPRMQRAFSAMPGLLRLGGGLLAGSALSRGIASYTRLADEATAMRNALSNAGLAGEELARVYEQLFKSAQKNSAPVGSLVDLYSKLALTQKELGVTSDDLIRFTDGIAVALKVAGTDATAASGSLLQLSQALGGGIVRAEEFNSILEGTPTIAQAVARGLKEAGGSVAELRKLVVKGEVSSAAFFRAFEAGSGVLRQQAANAQSTVGQAFTRIGNSLVTAAGDFDEASGASASLARIIGELADAVDGFDARALVGQVQNIADAFGDAEGAVSAWLRKMADAQVFADLNEALGIAEDGKILNPDVRAAEQKIDRLENEVKTLQAQIENNAKLGFDNTEAMARLAEVRAALAAVKAEAANLPRYVAGLRPDGSVVHDMQDTGTGITGYEAPPAPVASEPVSITDHPAGGSGGSGGGRRRSGGGGGGGRSTAPRQDDFAREIAQIKERTAALQIETAQLVLAATGERDLATAMDFARTKAELLVAAQQAGKTITPELESQIDGLAEAYSRAGRSAEDAAARMREVEERGQRGAEALTDTFMSVVDGSKSAKEALADLLREMARALIQQQLMQLFGGQSNSMGGATGGGGFGAAIGSMIGSWLSGGFAEGGFTGPGGKYEPAGVVHRGEYVMPSAVVKRVGADNLQRLHQSALRGYADGGLVGATRKAAKVASGRSGESGGTSAPSINITGGPITVNGGGTPEQNADLARQISAETEAAMRGMIQKELVQQMRSGNMLAGRR